MVDPTGLYRVCTADRSYVRQIVVRGAGGDLEAHPFVPDRATLAAMDRLGLVKRTILAEDLGIKTTALSSRCARLHKQGLIIDGETGRRWDYAAPSPAGLEALRRVAAPRCEQVGEPVAVTEPTSEPAPEIAPEIASEDEGPEALPADLTPAPTEERGEPLVPTDLLFAVLQATVNEMELDVELERGANSKGEPVVWATKAEGDRIELDGWLQDESLEDQVSRTGWLLQAIMGPWIQVDHANLSNAVRDFAEALGCNDDPEELGGDVGRLLQALEEAEDAGVPAAELATEKLRAQGRTLAKVALGIALTGATPRDWPEEYARVAELARQHPVSLERQGKLLAEVVRLKARVAELEAQVAGFSQPTRPAAPTPESLVLPPYERGRLEATLDAAVAAHVVWGEDDDEAMMVACHLGELVGVARDLVKGVPCV